ncbi:MAG: GTP-binding protein [Candidatus Hodarchaeota archaeon]
MAEEYDYLFKSIVVGDGGVGKTALTLRFSKGFFTEDYKMTIGVDFHVKTINIDSVEGLIRAKLQIWDTGGQERFSSIRPMYYRGSLGALLIFDLTNSASFEHLPQWIEEVRVNVKTEIPLLLVGNKSDLVELRAVSLEEINTFTSNFNLYYMETSAKTGEGVGDCFYILACLMIGSGVPDQLISRGIVFSPGKVPITGIGAYPTPLSQLEPELDYAAPPVPEPLSTITLEPEPEFEYEAPPVPEPIRIEKTEPSPIFEPEFEPEIPLPQTPVNIPSEQSVEFEFKTPEEILSIETAKKDEMPPYQPPIFTGKDETYKPKAVPFTSNVPIPAPAPKGFQAPLENPPIESSPSSVSPFLIPQDRKEPSSDSLMDYLPKPIYSKKEKKKAEKQKKKEEKEKKLKEEKEKQERLLTEMKKVKKEKKEKPKKEKKEKLESKAVASEPPRPTEEPTSAPSLFQTLSQKIDETEKTSVADFMPFKAKEATESQEVSKLRIIQNVSDVESKPIQTKTRKPSEKEIIICKQCGSILSSDYQFCNKCGIKL